MPGYPASHGCIRLPLAEARALFALTRAESTTVVIADVPIETFGSATTLAINTPMPQPGPSGPAQQPQFALANAEPKAPKIAFLPLFASAPPRTGPSQTIQLAAALSPGEADAHWAQLLSVHPELARFDKAVIPAVVGDRRYYRLRASAPGAYAVCSSLRQSGQDCFNVS